MGTLNLQALDYGIIAVYLLITFSIGIVAERWASRSGEAYFLGGRRLPWWALGASGMASNVDIGGTALAVGLIYAIGVQGFFIEIRGGIVLVMAVLLAFMGKWNRRSGVMTRAEWMIFRFGDGPGGRIARFASAAAEILFAIWVTAYFAKGLEVFVGPLTPFPPELVSIVVVAFVAIYAMAGGLTGVVWTDVFQGGLIFLAVIYICGMALGRPALPEEFAVSMPLGGGEFVERVVEYDEWSGAAPSRNLGFSEETTYSQYNAFWWLIGIWLIRTVMEGMSGSGGYMIQRYLAARNEREAGLVSLIWIFLLMFRWPLVISFAVLGIHYSLESGTPIANPEEVLPTVLGEMVPSGIKGLLVACFLAAFMSTLSSFLNSSAAYWTRDIYTAFLNRNATHRQEVWQGRAATALFVILGLMTSYLITDINAIWGFLQAAVAGGIIMPMFLRWYWWRYNGQGFATGLIAANVAALLFFFVIDAPEIYQFLTVAGVGLAGCLIGTYAFAPTPAAVLDNYYKVTRPFGFWKPVRDEVAPAEKQSIASENRNEILSLFLAVPWQLLLFVLPMVIILKEWGQAAVVGAAVILLTIGLYFTWYRKLSTREDREEILERDTLVTGEE